MKQKVITKSSQETYELGVSFAQKLHGGEVICLHGDLGAGKTTFTQGLAKGLGITGKIISPTFIILRTYHSRSTNNELKIKKFYHVDLYRIENEQDIEGLGLFELMEDQQAIMVIEWPEKIENLLPKNRKDIFFQYRGDDSREIVVQ